MFPFGDTSFFMQPNATRTITEPHNVCTINFFQNWLYDYAINRYTISYIIYPVFCFLPVSKLSSIATACSSADCIACVYLACGYGVSVPSLLTTVKPFPLTGLSNQCNRFILYLALSYLLYFFFRQLTI